VFTYKEIVTKVDVRIMTFKQALRNFVTL